MNLTLMFMFSFIVPHLIMALAIILGMKNKNYEKTSPFECGFSPLSKQRTPFSLKFFLISMIFLIFDAEIALLLPLSVIKSSISFMHLNFTTTFITLILILGLIHEWNEGSLEWSN